MADAKKVACSKVVLFVRFTYKFRLRAMVYEDVQLTNACSTAYLVYLINACYMWLGTKQGLLLPKIEPIIQKICLMHESTY